MLEAPAEDRRNTMSVRLNLNLLRVREVNIEEECLILASQSQGRLSINIGQAECCSSLTEQADNLQVLLSHSNVERGLVPTH